MSNHSNTSNPRAESLNVLLTGASGYLGSRVARVLTTRGHRVTATVRDPEKLYSLSGDVAATVVAPLENPDALARAAATVDAVVHTAFNHSGDFFSEVKIEHDAIAAVIQAVRGSGKAVIVSTANGVLGDTAADAVHDDFAGDLAFPGSVRRGIEGLVLDPDAGVRGIVIRPAVLVHGHGASQSVPLLINTAQRERLSAFIEQGANRISAVHVDDLAELYALALEGGPAGAVYNTAEEVPAATMRQIAEAVATAVNGIRAESVSMERASELWGQFPAFMLSINNQVTAKRAKDELGWRPGLGTPTLIDDLLRGSYTRHHE